MEAPPPIDSRGEDSSRPVLLLLLAPLPPPSRPWALRTCAWVRASVVGGQESAKECGKKVKRAPEVGDEAHLCVVIGWVGWGRMVWEYIEDGGKGAHPNRSSPRIDFNIHTVLQGRGRPTSEERASEPTSSHQSSPPSEISILPSHHQCSRQAPPPPPLQPRDSRRASSRISSSRGSRGSGALTWPRNTGSSTRCVIDLHQPHDACALCSIDPGQPQQCERRMDRVIKPPSSVHESAGDQGDWAGVEAGEGIFAAAARQALPPPEGARGEGGQEEEEEGREQQPVRVLACAIGPNPLIGSPTPTPSPLPSQRRRQGRDGSGGGGLAGGECVLGGDQGGQGTNLGSI